MSWHPEVSTRALISALLKQTSLLVLTSISILHAANLAAQEAGPGTRLFSLAGRAQVTLPRDWSFRSDAPASPPSLLVASAPHLIFSDLQVLENRNAPAILQVGVSDNPFLGGNAVLLDTRMRERLLRDLFYFFFPPPHACLSRAEAAFEKAERDKSERENESAESREKNHKRKTDRRTVSVAEDCEFSPTAKDFFASQLSQSISLLETPQGDRIEGRWRNFYQPPMDHVEIKGKTFFIFEARAEQAIELGDVDQFGLADDRRGARVHFFWAIGANTPFPFLRDPYRKDLQLLHVVFGTVSLDSNARSDFQSLLNSIAFDR